MSKLNKIYSKVASPQKIQTIFHEAWQVFSFPILKGLLQIIIEMLQLYVKVEMLEYCDKLYRNS